VTSIQALIDTRNQLDRHASPEPVEWHLAHINNRWARRSFAAAGFGFPSPTAVNSLPQWKPIYSVAAVGDASANQKQSTVVVSKDMESGDGVQRISSQSVTGSNTDAGGAFSGKAATLQGVNRPFFHIDIAAAVENAVANAEAKSGSAANSLKAA
jgi:sodium-independent sulfate anion transporter 11